MGILVRLWSLLMVTRQLSFFSAYVERHEVVDSRLLVGVSGERGARVTVQDR